MKKATENEQKVIYFFLESFSQMQIFNFFFKKMQI